MEPEKIENEQSQDNDEQTSSPSCVSKMNYALPRYRNNVSPAIDKIMRMMNMPSLITPEDDPSSDMPILTNRITSLNYYYDGDENFLVPTKEYLDVCFSSPKPFVSTYNRDSAEDRAQSWTKEIDPSLSQDAQKSLSSGRQEIADPLSDGEPVDPPRYEDHIYVSEAYFLLMASNRNRMRRALPERSRWNSKDSAFSEFMGSDRE